MMKKRVVALTTAAVMALSMTACGGGGGADKTASGDKEGGLSGEITVWSWDVALAHLEEWAEKFQEENPDVTFNFEEMGGSGIPENDYLPAVRHRPSGYCFY